MNSTFGCSVKWQLMRVEHAGCFESDPAQSPRVDIPLTRRPRFAHAIPRDDARCVAAWPLPSTHTHIRLTIIVCTATPDFSMHNEFFLSFRGKRISRSERRSARPIHTVVRKKIASPKLSQPANTHTSILSSLLVTKSPPMLLHE